MGKRSKIACLGASQLIKTIYIMAIIDITELAKHCPDVTISIKASDLIEANKKLVEDVRLSLEQKIRDEHEEKYLSSEEVCEMLDVSKPTLWRWEKMEYLIPLRVGGKVRYKLSEVRQILKTNNKKGGQR